MKCAEPTNLCIQIHELVHVIYCNDVVYTYKFILYVTVPTRMTCIRMHISSRANEMVKTN